MSLLMRWRATADAMSGASFSRLAFVRSLACACALFACGPQDVEAPAPKRTRDAAVGDAERVHDDDLHDAGAEDGRESGGGDVVRDASATEDAMTVGEQAPRTMRLPLVRPELWRPLEAEEDPFPDRPSPIELHCDLASVMAETLSDERVFSVDTGGCGYISAQQQTLTEVRAGEQIKVRLWHFALSAPQPAQAHAAVVLDGISVLDEQVPIPKPGGLLVRQVRAERAIPAGTPIYFHLHNHGDNSWSLVEISTGP